jgi:hypothetical protein
MAESTPSRALLLLELGRVGASLADAVVAGEVVAALAASHEARRLRAALAHAPEVGLADPELAELAGAAVAARGAVAIVGAWRARALPSPAELAASPLGIAVLADHLLPATWDVVRDLLVLVAPVAPALLEHLAAIGQARIIVVGEPAPPADAIAVADAAGAVAAVRAMAERPPERVLVRDLAGGDPAAADAIATAVHGALSDLRVHRNTVAQFSTTWLRQGLANLPAIAAAPSVDAIGDGLAGVPFVMVAPGPSLARNVAALRGLRGRAIVCAVSHALRPLRAAGVVPDLVIAVDPQDLRYHFAPGDLDGVTALINAVTVHPGLFALPGPRVLTLAGNGAIDRWLYEAVGGGAEVGGGGSVATTAVALALRWRCEPIVTVGLDLSYADGRVYATGSTDGEARLERHADGTISVAGWSEGFREMRAGQAAPARERVVELPGWHGGTVTSSVAFAMFHRWFVETATHTLGVRLVNCTEGGAAIAGMEHRALADEIAGWSATVDVPAAIAAAYARLDVERRRAGAARWRRRVERELRGAGRLAARGAALARRGDPRTEARLQVIEAEVARRLEPHGFVAMPAQGAIGDAVDLAHREVGRERLLAASGQLLAAAAATCRAVATAFAEVGRG